MNHWSDFYFGKPWVSGAFGPDAYNCWGLVYAVQNDVYGRDVPLITANELRHEDVKRAFRSNSEYQRWEQVNTPKEGDLVLTMQSPGDPDHVGIWINVDGGRVLQSVIGAGVIRTSLEATRRAIGQHVEFWRFKG